MVKPYRPHRIWRGQPFTEVQYRSYCLGIGQLVLTWNDFHEKLALLFTAILSYADRKRIPKKQRDEFELREMERLAGLWSSSLYDRPKREMLRGILVPLVLDDFIAYHGIEEDINWILDEADKLEDIRNNAVHSPMLEGLNFHDLSIVARPLRPDRSWMSKEDKIRLGVAPNTLMKNRRALRLAKNAQHDLLAEFRWAREATSTLRDFALNMVWALMREDVPWPRRPALPNRGQKKKRPVPQRQAPAK
jgi:hypothetical protein